MQLVDALALPWQVLQSQFHVSQRLGTLITPLKTTASLEMGNAGHGGTDVCIEP